MTLSSATDTRKVRNLNGWSIDKKSTISMFPKQVSNAICGNGYKIKKRYISTQNSHYIDDDCSKIYKKHADKEVIEYSVRVHVDNTRSTINLYGKVMSHMTAYAFAFRLRLTCLTPASRSRIASIMASTLFGSGLNSSCCTRMVSDATLLLP